MNLEIRATRKRKQLLKWLESEAVSFKVVATGEIERLQNSLCASAKLWGGSLSYEMGGVSVGDAIAAVMVAMEALATGRIIVWMGDAVTPLVIDVALSDFRKILANAADTEDVLTFTTADCQGRATIVMPTKDDDFLVSGSGQMELLIEDVQRRCLGGTVFRGN